MKQDSFFIKLMLTFINMKDGTYRVSFVLVRMLLHSVGFNNHDTNLDYIPKNE